MCWALQIQKNVKMVTIPEILYFNVVQRGMLHASQFLTVNFGVVFNKHISLGSGYFAVDGNLPLESILP